MRGNTTIHRVSAITVKRPMQVRAGQPDEFECLDIEVETEDGGNFSLTLLTRPGRAMPEPMIEAADGALIAVGFNS